MKKESMMNKAAASEPKSGHSRPAHAAGVGNERKANMHGALDGNQLGHAVRELHSQHPIKHDDHGPHHGGNTHVRHEPLHGMRPSKG